MSTPYFEVRKDPVVIQPNQAERINITPWDHQTAAWNHLDSHFQQKGRKAGILVVPTGGGKTFIAAHWLMTRHINQGGRILWLAHRHTLLNQALKSFYELGRLACNIETLWLDLVSSQNMRFADTENHHQLIFATLQTTSRDEGAYRALEMVKNRPDEIFVVVDEAHHAAASSYLRLLRELKSTGAKLLGLTATPVRTDEQDQANMVDLFGRHHSLIYQVSKYNLVSKGILATPVPETVKTRVEAESTFTPEDYSYLERFGELSSHVLERIAKNAARNKLIVEHWLKKRDDYGKTLVFAVDIAHATILANEFAAKGVKAEYVASNRGHENQDILEDFRKNGIEVLVNVEMCTEGYDAPNTQTVLITRPTRSQALVSQMVGRAMRGRDAGGTEIAHLVTFEDTWELYHPLDAEYVLKVGDASEIAEAGRVSTAVVLMSYDLILGAYRLLDSIYRGEFVSFHECLPWGWYMWEQEQEEGDFVRRHVLVFDNQRYGFDKMLKDTETLAAIAKGPKAINDDLVETLIGKHFSDVPDPRPQMVDVAGLLYAKAEGTTVHWYTLKEKKEIEPENVAKRLAEATKESNQHVFLKAVSNYYDETPICSILRPGRDGKRKFSEDVLAARDSLLIEEFYGEVAEGIEDIAEKCMKEPAEFSSGDSYQLMPNIWNDVTSKKCHFPDSPPDVNNLRYSSIPIEGSKINWGFYRRSDREVIISSLLNSPRVPRMIVEYVVFEKLLQSVLKNNSTQSEDFVNRAKRFQPSEKAQKEAKQLGVSSTEMEWSQVAQDFLKIFEKKLSPVN